VNTVTPCGTVTCTSAEQTTIANQNSLIRAQWWQFGDALADLNATPNLTNPTNTTYYAADQIHMTNAGYAIVGGVWQSAVNSITGGTAPTAASSLSVTPPASTLTGTSGTASCSESLQGTLKMANCYLNGYAENGTAQTYSFPTAFSTTPVLQESNGSCGAYNPTTTASVLTLPANASSTAETCNVVLIGQ
jgi:hypothetical protein